MFLEAEAVEVEPQEPDVESLRREVIRLAIHVVLFTCVNRKARDTLLKAARDGRLASAFSEMRKAAEVSSEKCVAKELSVILRER